MLVANDVRLDSRVQKAAYSAAEAGYDVLLLGYEPSRKGRPSVIADPQGKLCPIPSGLCPAHLALPVVRMLSWRPGAEDGATTDADDFIRRGHAVLMF